MPNKDVYRDIYQFTRKARWTGRYSFTVDFIKPSLLVRPSRQTAYLGLVINFFMVPFLKKNVIAQYFFRLLENPLHNRLGTFIRNLPSSSVWPPIFKQTVGKIRFKPGKPESIFVVRN